MSLNLDKIKFNNEKVGFCRFKEFGNKYLITNDVGHFILLTPELFKNYLEGKINEKTKLYQEDVILLE